MDFKLYQECAMSTAVYPGRGTGSWNYPILGLAGETGEICEKLKKAIRDDGGGAWWANAARRSGGSWATCSGT